KCWKRRQRRVGASGSPWASSPGPLTWRAAATGMPRDRRTGARAELEQCVAGPSSCDLHPADAHTASRFRQLVVHSTLEFSTAALPVFRSERFGLGGDCGRNGTAGESFVASDNDRTRMNPGDDAPPGTPGTGEDVC